MSPLRDNWQGMRTCSCGSMELVRGTRRRRALEVANPLAYVRRAVFIRTGLARDAQGTRAFAAPHGLTTGNIWNVEYGGDKNGLQRCSDRKSLVTSVILGLNLSPIWNQVLTLDHSSNERATQRGTATLEQALARIMAPGRQCLPNPEALDGSRPSFDVL